jgi:outer membrane biosynthesis protein TonB
MKLIEALSATVLFLLPLTIAPAYAQKEHEGEKEPQQKQQQAKPAQHQAKPQQRDAQRQQQAKPAEQPKQAERQQQAKPAQQQQRAQHQQQAKPAQQQQRPERQQQANRSQPAASHGRIPDDRFRASFGREHSFHVNRSDFEGSRRFQYGGFWFSVIDPWPVGWLYTDNVYVDYINGGYFLCNPVHPGVYISINIG